MTNWLFSRSYVENGQKNYFYFQCTVLIKKYYPIIIFYIPARTCLLVGGLEQVFFNTSIWVNVKNLFSKVKPLAYNRKLITSSTLTS